MAKARVGAGLMAGCLLLGGGASAAWAAPTVAQMLSYRPKQEGVLISTPAPAEFDACKVELVKGSVRGSGWLLRDPSGNPLRRYFDTKDSKKVDVWSYYYKGQEVYREIDSNGNEKPDQFRWLNTGGMKWGVDINEDGKIDAWKAISPEEVSQEIVQALATRDVARLQALQITDQEIRSLEIPTAEAARIRASLKQSTAKFQDTVSKLPASGPATWMHLETQAPLCQPPDTTGMKQDLIRYKTGTILYEIGGKTDWMQTGEMIQIGLAWRITDAPAPGQSAPIFEGGDNAAETTPIDPSIQPLLNELSELDKKAPRVDSLGGQNAEVVKYHLLRSDILEKIVARVKPENRDQWLRQQADSYSAAAQSSAQGDKTAITRLQRLADHLAKEQPGSAIAGYVTFREMQAEYTRQLHEDKPDYGKVQEGWLERLKKFVQDYPRAEDTPDALLQLAMVSEFIGKETEAKNWYNQLLKNFPEHPHCRKAKGALRRLESEGKELELAGTVLGTSQTFDIVKMRGKAVVVYYWASWNQQSIADFSKLKLLLSTYASKGLDLVCVNMDNSAGEANSFVLRTSAPGTHLYQEGGLESPFALDYGILGLPNLFLVGKDGKVVSRTVQVTNLEDELKKLLDK